MEATKEILSEHITVLDNQLEEVYEAVFGLEGMDNYDHEELLDRLYEMYNCYQYVVDNVYAKGERL